VSILAIDTCFEGCSAAALSGDPEGVFAAGESFRLIGQGHAEQLMAMIAEAMTGAEAPFRTLTRIGVTVGPGTFTGTRIGIAAARGLALATGARLASVSSLVAVAWRTLHDDAAGSDGSPVLVCMDARRDQVYGQLVEATGVPAGDPMLLDVDDAARRFAARMVTLVGTGSLAVARARASIAAAPARVLEGVSLANLAGSMLARVAGLPLAGGPVRPLYLRPPDAKPQEGSILAARG
jgi:tRNA threonylcarbamoyladenosine biosynthesis protein TsaB